MAIDGVVRALASLFAWVALAVVLAGMLRSLRRPRGTTSGATSWLRSAWFYVVGTVLFLGVCWASWSPLPLEVPPVARTAGLAVGSLVYFPGLALVLWGRFALGRNYSGSTSLGAQLFADHELVTTGPYAFVRHPMYVGLILSAFGSLVIFATWTTLFLALCAPWILLRARREEQVLAAGFGDRWTDYCRRVPPFLPRLRR